MWKNKYACFNDVIWLMAIKARLKMKNGTLIYDINRPRPRHGHKYTKYRMYLSIKMFICIKQHLSNIWSSVQENAKQHSAWAGKKKKNKKNAAYEKACIEQYVYCNYLFSNLWRRKFWN